jgi:hypothetical protein
LLNSKKEVQSQIFRFEEVNVEIEEFDSEEEYQNKSPTPRLDFSDNRLSNSLNEESYGSKEDTGNQDFMRQGHSSERGYKS